MIKIEPHEVKELVEKIKQEMIEVIGDKNPYVSFSGGLDSTVVALIAKDAFGPDRVPLVNVVFGPYSYSKSMEAILILTRKMGMKPKFVSGRHEQEKILVNGPNCNKCTRDVKMGMVRKAITDIGGIVMTGANQSDSWGKSGIKVMDGFYSPLLDLDKTQIRAILAYYNYTIPKVGENANREGCKHKHLLKMIITKDFHGRAMAISNEIIHDILDQYNYEREIANVKIIGPLSKNYAIVNVKPIPNDEIKNLIIETLKKEETINEILFADRPLELYVSANPGIVNNEESRYWVDKGRIQPEFAVPIKIRWIPNRNNKLRTFAIVDAKYLDETKEN